MRRKMLEKEDDSFNECDIGAMGEYVRMISEKVVEKNELFDWTENETINFYEKWSWTLRAKSSKPFRTIAAQSTIQKHLIWEIFTESLPFVNMDLMQTQLLGTNGRSNLALCSFTHSFFCCFNRMFRKPFNQREASRASSNGFVEMKRLTGLWLITAGVICLLRKVHRRHCPCRDQKWDQRKPLILLWKICNRIYSYECWLVSWKEHRFEYICWCNCCRFMTSIDSLQFIMDKRIRSMEQQRKI